MSEQQEAKKLELAIPTFSGDPLKLTLAKGDRVFIVGANGSGKSALIQHIVAKKPGNYMERIPAHRRTWFHTDSVDITARDRLNYSKSNFHQELEDESRWTDVFAQERQSAVLFDLVDSENLRARTIAQFVDNHEMENARKTAAASASPFARINELLKIGNLAVSLEYSNFERLLARHQNGSEQYSIAQMSDGERSAATIAAMVLTVLPGTILLIDKPERHLHPSISKPFLRALFQCRSDCTFVVSTNDIALPAAHSEARVLLVRSCRWLGTKADAWDLDLLEPKTELPEDLRRDILGSRKRILFVEGADSGSLDLSIYRELFPGISIISKGSCTEVTRAVYGLRNAKDLHRVEAFGLIDRDNRLNDEIEELANCYVFALDVCTVESLYYCSDAIAAVAHQQAASLDDSADQLFEAARKRALAALGRGRLSEEMAARRCERKLQDKLQSKSPGWKQIRDFPEQVVEESVEPFYCEEMSKFDDLLAKRNLDTLVARYPLKYSNVFPEIARALKLDGRDTYERMLLARVRSDAKLAQNLRQRTKSLTAVLEK